MAQDACHSAAHGRYAVFCVPLDCQRRSIRSIREKWRRSVPPPRRLTTLGVVAPVGNPQFPLVLSQGQSSDPSAGHPCSRQCLLKGCETLFLPRHFWDYYCSPNCRIAAQRWRRWRAAQIYRATAKGKQRRREQARCHRERKRFRSASSMNQLYRPSESSRSHPRRGQWLFVDRLTNRWDRSPKWSQFRSARRARAAEWPAGGVTWSARTPASFGTLRKGAESNRTRNLVWLNWERTGRPGVRAW